MRPFTATDFVGIAPGTFLMGSPSHESGRHSNERLHTVTLTRGFFIQKTPVTQEQWQALMGNNSSLFENCDTCPVEHVTWFDAIDFANAMSREEGLPEVYDDDGSLMRGSDIYATTGYRLPTEAEWEYACRAGTTTRWYNGDDESKVGEIAWVRGNSNDRTHPVARKQPNAWGLYDMIGNVDEWCHDWCGPYQGTVTDPAGPGSGLHRVFRGGSWLPGASGARAAARSWDTPDYRDNGLGFRLARSRP